jgi:arsenite methyltransferase
MTESEEGSTHVSPDEPHREVRDRYGRIAKSGSSCCGSESGSGCGCGSGSGCCPDGGPSSSALGYAPTELGSLPEGVDLGLGCGNPTGLLSLGEGDRVLDLGSGAGIDCFLAARRVGDRGKVVGVDMTPPMIDRARAAARHGGFQNVEFRLGEIEHLPCADASFDVVLSNCVINLAPDKKVVFAEAYRVLRPGGRLAVSDMVATRPIPDELRRDPERWSGCSSGAISAEEVRTFLADVGFGEIRVERNGATADGPGLDGGDSIGVVPMSIRARKPTG